VLRRAVVRPPPPPRQLIRTASKALDFSDSMAPILAMLLQRLTSDHISAVVAEAEGAGGAGAVGPGGRRPSTVEEGGGGAGGAAGITSPVPSSAVGPSGDATKDSALKKVGEGVFLLGGCGCGCFCCGGDGGRSLCGKALESGCFCCVCCVYVCS
jgi:hypothetical protein